MCASLTCLPSLSVCVIILCTENGTTYAFDSVITRCDLFRYNLSYHIMLHFVILCHVMSWYDMLCYVMQYNVLLRYVLLNKNFNDMF